MAIRVGVAGWDYADWKGPVYPTAAAGDRLAFIARFVDVVEINSSFYRHAAPRSAESWVRRTEKRAGFRFTAKGHRSWTHDPAPLDPNELRRGLLGLAPLREADRLGALLLQFPPSFHHGPAALERLDRLLDSLAGWRPVVEVRHRSWSDDGVESWLAERGAGWCLVDQPRASRSTIEPLDRVSVSPAYVRLHGRNARDWFRPDAGRDARYDYRYSRAELDELAGRIRGMASRAEELFVIQNNHFRGQALVNALQMKHLLTGERPTAPDTLIAAYPDLAAEVVVERQRLF